MEYLSPPISISCIISYIIIIFAKIPFANQKSKRKGDKVSHDFHTDFHNFHKKFHIFHKRFHTRGNYFVGRL